MEINLWQVVQFIRKQNKLKKRGMDMNQITVVHKQQLLNNTFTIYGTKEEPLFLAKDVATWIGHTDLSRMVGLVEEDEKLKRTLYVSGQKREMWFLTEDGLYEVLMQSRKPIAKQFKKEVKHILKNIRKHGGHLTNQTIEQALLNPDMLIQLANNIKSEQEKRLAAEQAVIEANQIIEQQKPKVLFAESVSASETSILVREFSKILKQNNIDFGEKRLFHWLRENGYLIKRPGSDYNSPTQRSMDMKLFEVKETPINRSDGISIMRTSKITGKGQLYFLEKLREVNKDELSSHQEISRV